MTPVTTAVSVARVVSSLAIPVEISAAFHCDNCERLVLATAVVHSPLGWDKVHTYLAQGPERALKWLPLRGVPKSFLDVPEYIAAAASEAHECDSIGCHRAAIALARSVLEATAKDKGFTTGNLVNKIDTMHQQGLIRQHIQEVAHEIRHLGNDMAHGDFVDPVTAEESDLALTLMAEVLAEVYQSPARVARARRARENKRDGTAPNGVTGVVTTALPGVPAEGTPGNSTN